MRFIFTPYLLLPYSFDSISLLFGYFDVWPSLLHKSFGSLVRPSPYAFWSALSFLQGFRHPFQSPFRLIYWCKPFSQSTILIIKVPNCYPYIFRELGLVHGLYHSPVRVLPSYMKEGFDIFRFNHLYLLSTKFQLFCIFHHGDPMFFTDMLWFGKWRHMNFIVASIWAAFNVAIHDLYLLSTDNHLN